ncbi:LacI family transcriptional regulator [Natronospirillum operosum]|uniref:LacI family transcriptional regulator n=1 Tax=Natronospirillum operosum TaxID=2759953 RepID=A0A4Z0WEI5_9GAMM|nr:substrate-binding domain-containing protein [Natronospirillum operosum]TGG95038.1 LacI family transcriptional regulator [Natronospirillum operosum]
MRTLKLTILGWLFGSVLYAHADCVGVITAGGGYVFWGEVERGAEAAADELGLTLYTRGAADEINVQAQGALIERISNLGCRGLVLAPNSVTHLERIASLNAEGIPTVFVDRDIGGDRVSVIKTDNDYAGALAAREMINALGTERQVAVFRMDPEVATTTEREEAFIRTLQDAGVTLVVSDYLGTEVGDARENAYALLVAHPEIEVVFTPNESTSLGTQAAIKRLPVADRPIHIGFDANPRLIQAVEDGDMLGLVEQSPFEMGYQGIRTVHRAMHQQAVELYQSVPATFRVRSDASGG